MSDSVWPQRRQPRGSPIPGILQARTLEWVAISFSNAWTWKVKVKSLSRVQLLATPWTAAYQAPPSMGFSRQEYWSRVPLPSRESYYYQKNYNKSQPEKMISFSGILKWRELYIYIIYFIAILSLSLSFPSSFPPSKLMPLFLFTSPFTGPALYL